MEYGNLGTWFGHLVTLAVAGAAWWRAGQREDDKERHALEERAAGLDRRVTTLETQIKTLPSDASIDKLADRLNQLHGDLRELSGRFAEWGRSQKAVEDAVQHVNSYLLNKGHHE